MRRLLRASMRGTSLFGCGPKSLNLATVRPLTTSAAPPSSPSTHSGMFVPSSIQLSPSYTLDEGVLGTSSSIQDEQDVFPMPQFSALDDPAYSIAVASDDADGPFHTTAGVSFPYGGGGVVVGLSFESLPDEYVPLMFEWEWQGISADDPSTICSTVDYIDNRLQAAGPSSNLEEQTLTCGVLPVQEIDSYDDVEMVDQTGDQEKDLEGMLSMLSQVSSTYLLCPYLRPDPGLFTSGGHVATSPLLIRHAENPTWSPMLAGDYTFRMKEYGPIAEAVAGDATEDDVYEMVVDFDSRMASGEEEFVPTDWNEVVVVDGISVECGWSLHAGTHCLEVNEGRSRSRLLTRDSSVKSPEQVDGEPVFLQVLNSDVLREEFDRVHFVLRGTGYAGEIEGKVGLQARLEMDGQEEIMEFYDELIDSSQLDESEDYVYANPTELTGVVEWKGQGIVPAGTIEMAAVVKDAETGEVTDVLAKRSLFVPPEWGCVSVRNEEGQRCHVFDEDDAVFLSTYNNDLSLDEEEEVEGTLFVAHVMGVQPEPDDEGSLVPQLALIGQDEGGVEMLGASIDGLGLTDDHPTGAYMFTCGVNAREESQLATDAFFYRAGFELRCGDEVVDSNRKDWRDGADRTRITVEKDSVSKMSLLGDLNLPTDPIIASIYRLSDDGQEQWVPYHLLPTKEIEKENEGEEGPRTILREFNFDPSHFGTGVYRLDMVVYPSWLDIVIAQVEIEVVA